MERATRHHPGQAGSQLPDYDANDDLLEIVDDESNKTTYNAVGDKLSEVSVDGSIQSMIQFYRDGSGNLLGLNYNGVNYNYQFDRQDSSWILFVKEVERR